MVNEFPARKRVYCCSTCTFNFERAAARDAHQRICTPFNLREAVREINMVSLKREPKVSDLYVCVDKIEEEPVYDHSDHDVSVRRRDFWRKCETCGCRLYMFYGCPNPFC